MIVAKTTWGFWSLTGGVAESRNFGEAWGVCAGRPGSSPEPPEDARVVLEEPGLPRVREDRDEVTSKVVRRPREVTVFWWPAPPRGGTARWPPGSAEGDARAGFRLSDTSAHCPGDTGVKSGHPLVTGRRGYTRAVRGYSEGIAPGQNQAHAGSLPRNTQTPEATVHHPRVEPGRALGLGGTKAKPARNPDVTRV